MINELTSNDATFNNCLCCWFEMTADKAVELPIGWEALMVI